MFRYVRTRFNVATYATSNHVNFAEEKVKTVIYFSKVFFVKGKGGKRASRFSSAVCGRAPPERPKERQQEESRGQNDREKREGEENERERERHYYI